MAFTGIRRRLARIVSIYRDIGPIEFLLRVLRKLDGGRGVISRKARAFRERKESADRAYDGDNQVDTGGIQHLYDLTIAGPHAQFGTSHIASDPAEFATALAATGVDYADRVFVDLGSGKGRALLMAAAYPFRRLIGVEFAAELHRIAAANIAARSSSQPPIELVHADAAQFDFPNEPLLVFLYHPFQAEVMDRVAGRLLASWRALPRPVTVLYLNPVYAESWTAAGWCETGAGHHHRVYGPPQG